MTDNTPSKMNADDGDKKMLGGLVRFMDQIPILPGVVIAAQDLINQPLLDIDKLVTVLESDPGIVAKILRIANSSFYGLSREIKSVRDACIVLGQYTLRNVIITTVVASTAKVCNVEKKECQELLEHCINTAVISRILAGMTGQNRDVAYIVGLLHDIGSFFIEAIAPDDAISIREDKENAGWVLEQAERQYLGFDHAELSGEVARYWKLPEEIAVSLQFHHDIEHNVSAMNDLIYVADYLSMNLDNYDDDQDVSDVLSDGLLQRLGIDNAKITECINLAKSSNVTELSIVLGRD